MKDLAKLGWKWWTTLIGILAFAVVCNLPWELLVRN